MSLKHCLFGIASTALAVADLGQAQNAPGSQPGLPQIWFVANAYVENPPVPKSWVRRDGADLWTPDAPWKTVASHTQVAKLIAGNIEHTKDEDLKRMLSDIERRNLILALEIGLLTRSDRCQSRTEAYGSPGELKLILEKIRRNGGDLRYIAMDEPFTYGHRDPGGCHESAQELAREVAENVSIARQVFPKVQVGDIEVVGAERSWIDELAGWADAYRAAVGESLAFLHTDIDWSNRAIDNLVPLEAALKIRQVPLGIIYNSDSGGVTDEAWMQSAISHFTQIEGGLGIRPAAAIFQSWTVCPSKTLPENQPGTLTNIALQYLRPTSTLSISQQGQTISGRLTDSSGKPISKANITVTGIDTEARTGPTLRTFSGVVPAGAATAVVGIRVNLEGAYPVAGKAGAAIGGIHYREQGTARQEDVSPVTLPISGAPDSVRTLQLAPDKTFGTNLKQFPVTAGAKFTLEAPIMATANAEQGGYVTIVFLDASGKGVDRRNLWFSPSQLTLGTVATDSDGKFRFDQSQTTLSAHLQIRVDYSGNPLTRSATRVLGAPGGSPDTIMPALVQILPASRSATKTKLALFGARGDFIQLFQSDTAWQQGTNQWSDAATRMQVVKFSTQFLTSVPDDILARIVRELAAKHIAIGLESLATNWYHEPPCGGGIEGYADPGSANKIVSKLMKAGGSLSLIAMDEPLFFGHYYTGKNACQGSIQDVAARVAVIIRIYTAAFPNVIVGDTEPFPAVSSKPDWATEYGTWVKAFDKAVGTPLTFLHLDFNWGDPRLNMGPAHNIPNPTAIAELAKTVAGVARANGLEVGMIYNGNDASPSDSEWMLQAQTHIRYVEASGISPDQVLFESWAKHPTRCLPETDPTALLNLIGYYFQHYR